jgi:hypothetical protein
VRKAMAAAGTGGAYLKKVDFELLTNSIDLAGELYISPFTWRLSYVISVETLMVEAKGGS